MAIALQMDDPEYTINQQDTLIERLQWENKRLRTALSDARDALHNDFEPDNQSNAYKRASAALEQQAEPPK